MSLIIQGGKIFVEGKETVDVNLIGYALLDFAEDINSLEQVFQITLNKEMVKEVQTNSIESPPNLFNPKDMVYLVHDFEQLPRMVTKIVIDDLGVMYEVASGTDISVHYNFELSKTKTVF
jgi:hypothetical protein